MVSLKEVAAYEQEEAVFTDKLTTLMDKFGSRAALVKRMNKKKLV